MSIRIECAPKITRVHTLHRIRTIVNYVNELHKENAPIIDDFVIAKHLISKHLSKPTTDSFRDQIGRRARDHLETARYLGLLYRKKVGYKFKHLPTNLGEKLFSYSFEEECPKDYLEEAIFIDRICRMKLVNASYMQTPRGYKDYRERICLNILAALHTSNSPLSIFQLGTILSKKSLDIFLHKKEFELIVEKVNSISYEKQYLEKLSSNDRRNIRRDTLPFIDWCVQVDLVRRKEDSVFLTERGKNILGFYSKMMPIWWHDFREWPELTAAIILLINYLKTTSKKFLIKKIIKKAIKPGLFTISIEKIMRRNLRNYFEAALDSNLIFDFSFQYDVPTKSFDEVLTYIQAVLKEIGYEKSASEVIEHLEFYTMKRIVTKLKKEAVQKQKEIKDKQQIDVKLMSTSILAQFLSPYEATSYLHFKAIESDNFKVEKYQAQLSEFFINHPKYKSFSKNNPDLMLTNDFLGLVECKSIAEWGNTLKLRKHIISEIEFYNHYCEAIKDLGIKDKCVVVICYEGNIKPQDKNEIIQLIKANYPNVVIITYSYLQKALINPSIRNSLKDVIVGREREVVF